MDCPYCKTENPDGRETCVMCKQPLIDIQKVMARDRWSGRAVNTAVLGIFAGAAAGVLLGILVGALLGNAGDAFVGGWTGLWLGGIAGCILGGILGILIARSRY